jgi:hypothetical protein
MKNDLKMKFEKEKEKKRKPHRPLSAQAAQAAHQPASRAGPPYLSPFSFSTETLTAGAHLSASPLPPSFLLPPAASRPSHAAARFPPRPAASPPSLLLLAII